MSKKLTLFEWYLCCLFCCQNKYNKIDSYVYEYGDNYILDEYTGKLILHKKEDCTIM